MPAKDDEYRDGTYSALPPVAFGDALSGSLDDADEHDEFKLTKVASPVRPDPARLQELVDAALAERKGESTDQQAPIDGAPPGAIPPQPPLGMLPKQRSRPGLRGVRRPQLKMPQLRMPQAPNMRVAKPSTGSTAMIVAVLLMIVFAFVAIEFLSSLISSISGLFN